ncbi:Platelet-activating factor acetylhydrolase [Varanus komodoensis]|nr:Platelet-activating factor acetylhydrolase [Varanus komodoensis]
MAMRSNFKRIPAGKGPYSVGCTDLMTGHGIQGIFLRLYYPCQNGTSSEETIWIPKKEYYHGLSDFLNIYRTLGEFLFASYVGSVTCPAKWNATIKPGEKYPLIIFSHGLGAFRVILHCLFLAVSIFNILLYCLMFCCEHQLLGGPKPGEQLGLQWQLGRGVFPMWLRERRETALLAGSPTPHAQPQHWC